MTCLLGSQTLTSFAPFMSHPCMLYSTRCLSLLLVFSVHMPGMVVNTLQARFHSGFPKAFFGGCYSHPHCTDEENESQNSHRTSQHHTLAGVTLQSCCCHSTRFFLFSFKFGYFLCFSLEQLRQVSFKNNPYHPT